jgi:hypothetical protein
MEIISYFLDFLQCIKRLYNCQNAKIEKEDCPNVKLCVQDPIKKEEEGIEIPASYLPPPPGPAATNSPAASNNNKPQIPITGIDLPAFANGNGKPVGVISEGELLRPSTTYSPTAPSTAYTTPIPVMGSKPTNRKLIF